MSPVNAPLVRVATAADALAIARVNVETWRSAYRGIVAAEHLAALSVDRAADRWRECFEDEPEQRPLILVADDMGDVVGFVCGGETRQPTYPFDAEMYALYVEPRRQGEGLGRRLVSAFVTEPATRGFRGLLVGVLDRNAPGRRFYESIGGQHVGDHSLEIGGQSHAEVFYGWPSMRDIGT